MIRSLSDGTHEAGIGPHAAHEIAGDRAIVIGEVFGRYGASSVGCTDCVGEVMQQRRKGGWRRVAEPVLRVQPPELARHMRRSPVYRTGECDALESHRGQKLRRNVVVARITNGARVPTATSPKVPAA
jgi:hypothetical protein